MASGFMLVTMEAMVLESLSKFLRAATGLMCLEHFQSMLMKIMFASSVLCSSGTVPELAGHADDMVLLVVAATA